MDRLAGVNAKVERAKEHVRDLDAALNSFLDSDPYEIGTQRDPQTRKLHYYLARVEEPPAVIATIAGDVIQNLRSALDHLAHQLVAVGIGHEGPHRHVYYPIAGSAAKYKANKRRQVKGMRAEASKAIDATKPYRGGTDLLWQLNELNNTDKHRLLVTVGGSFGSVDVMPTMLSNLPDGFPGKSQLAAFPPLFLKPANTQFPLKAGDVLFTDAADAEPNDKIQFRIEVTLSEPGIVEGEPLLKTVKDMLDLVEGLIPPFGPLLR